MIPSNSIDRSNRGLIVTAFTEEGYEPIQVIPDTVGSTPLPSDLVVEPDTKYFFANANPTSLAQESFITPNESCVVRIWFPNGQYPQTNGSYQPGGNQFKIVPSRSETPSLEKDLESINFLLTYGVQDTERSTTELINETKTQKPQAMCGDLAWVVKLFCGQYFPEYSVEVVGAVTDRKLNGFTDGHILTEITDTDGSKFTFDPSVGAYWPFSLYELCENQNRIHLINYLAYDKYALNKYPHPHGTGFDALAWMESQMFNKDAQIEYYRRVFQFPYRWPTFNGSLLYRVPEVNGNPVYEGSVALPLLQSLGGVEEVV